MMYCSFFEVVYLYAREYDENRQWDQVNDTFKAIISASPLNNKKLLIQWPEFVTQKIAL
jgi:hypothetical protein